MAVITMRQMLEAGVHFGHQTRRWNPKMKRFIFGERNGIYIIDLEQTLTRVERAYAYVRDLTAGGGVILFVGTKKQAQDPVRSYAEKCGMPYVNERWLGGMLTNFDTISKRVGKMLEYERMRDSGEFDAMPKKEALILSRELEKLQRNLGGLRGLNRRPDAIFVLDTKKEHIAVTEANKLGIPVVAVVDTNVDPELVQYPIPGNDDAIRANSLLARVIADAVEEGRFISAKREPGAAPMTRTAEQEAEFKAQQAAARREAAAAQAARERRLEDSTTRTAEVPERDDTSATAAAEPAASELGDNGAVVQTFAEIERTDDAPGDLSGEAAVAAPADVSGDASGEAAVAAPADVSGEASGEAAVAAPADDAPGEAAVAAPADVSGEASGEAAVAAPADVSGEASGEAAVAAPADVSGEASGEAAVAAPADDAPGEAAVAAPADVSGEASGEAAVAAPADVSGNASGEAAVAAPADDAAGDLSGEAAVAAPADVSGDASGEAAVAAPAAPSGDAPTSSVTTAGPYGPGSAAAGEGSSGPTGFDIKGNVESKLYHVPGSRYYEATVAEVWFDNVEHAEAAGFTAPEPA